METKSVKKPKSQSPDISTQRILAFSSIRDNIIYLKDSSARMVLKCGSINFLLKSTEEQDALIISFQRFLNSLKFPVQILVRSKKLDLDSYINNLKQKALKQTNKLLQDQTYEYINFLEKIIEFAQIMKKEFYIVVPYDGEGNISVRDTSILAPFKNFWNSIWNSGVDISTIKIQIKKHYLVQKELYSRANSVKIGLENIGIKAQELEKEELVKFLIDYYNPRLDNLNLIKGEIKDYDFVG